MAKKKAYDKGKKSNEDKQFAIVVTLIASLIIVPALLYFLGLFQPIFILLFILGVLVFLYSQSQAYLIQLNEYERAIIFRMGKYLKTSGPGWVVLTPFIDSYRLVDLRTQTSDPKEQDVVTKDNITLKVNAVAYYRVMDPKRAVLNVENYKGYLVQYIESTLRSIIGKLSLEQVVSNIETINAELRKLVQLTAQDWGLDIQKVELESVTLPDTLVEAMHQKRAAVEKKNTIRELAEAKKLQIEAIQEAAGKLTDTTLRYLYIDSLNKIADGKSNKIIFPLELTKLATALSNRLDEPYEKAQEDVIDVYEQYSKAEPGTKARILHAVRKELNLPMEAAAASANVRGKKRKQKATFEF